MRQVDPDLVGAAVSQPALDQARDRLSPFCRLAVEALQHLPMGDGHAPWRGPPCVAAVRMAAERLVDGAFGRAERAPDERQIAAPQRAGAAMVGERAASDWCAPVGLATTISPVVSLSSRCTCPAA